MERTVHADPQPPQLYTAFPPRTGAALIHHHTGARDADFHILAVALGGIKNSLNDRTDFALTLRIGKGSPPFSVDSILVFHTF